ncbi:MAG: hypothetical protein J5I90_07330 [Caldilineales bacterium]|nr:hypothetical protein [Caldilineales bacterium]
MFGSLKRFIALPDYVQVWPGHGAGSACGKALGAVPSSTVGYEKLVNWALQIADEDAFVRELLAGQPEPPRYFAMMKKLNKLGPEVLGGLPHPARLSLGRFKTMLDSGIRVVDTRDKFAFAGGHVPGSLNIQDNESFTTWAGWMLDYEEPFILVANDNRVEELTKALVRIGLDNAVGYIPGLEFWASTGHELEVLHQMTADQLFERHLRGDVAIIDVRNQNEFEESHIPGAIKIQAGQLSDHLDKIPRKGTVVLHCLGGDRSSVASSYLLGQGFDNVVNLTGGIRCWWDAGYPVERGAEPQLVSG